MRRRVAVGVTYFRPRRRWSWLERSVCLPFNVISGSGVGALVEMIMRRETTRRMRGIKSMVGWD